MREDKRNGLYERHCVLRLSKDDFDHVNQIRDVHDRVESRRYTRNSTIGRVDNTVQQIEEAEDTFRSVERRLADDIFRPEINHDHIDLRHFTVNYLLPHRYSYSLFRKGNHRLCQPSVCSNKHRGFGIGSL